MEKELIINGIKYIRADYKQEYKIGDIVEYNDYEWYVIKVQDNNVTLMMKDVLSNEEITEYFTDKNYVKYNVDKTNYDWKDTYIRKVLNKKFLEKFNKVELNIMHTNYDEDKYSDDHIRIPTIREIEKLDEGIRKATTSYWTMSPSYFSAGNASARVWCVNSAGQFSNWGVDASIGVRPVINLKSEYLNNENTGE